MGIGASGQRAKPEAEVSCGPKKENVFIWKQGVIHLLLEQWDICHAMQNTGKAFSITENLKNR